MNKVQAWVDDGEWIHVSSDIPGSEEEYLEKMCTLVERAKKNLLISASSFYCVRTHPDLYMRFIKALRKKFLALKEDNFHSITLICGRRMFSTIDGGEAPLISVIREFIGTLGFRIYVGSQHLYNQAVIADDVRGMIVSEHKETGPKSYKVFKSYEIFYLARVAAEDDQLENGRTQPLITYYDVKPTQKEINDWMERVFITFSGTKEEWDVTYESDWDSTVDERKKDDLSFLEKVTKERLTGLVKKLGF